MYTYMYININCPQTATTLPPRTPIAGATLIGARLGRVQLARVLRHLSDIRPRRRLVPHVRAYRRAVARPHDSRAHPVAHSDAKPASNRHHTRADHLGP